MKRLLIGLVAAVLALLSFAVPAAAQHKPELGCHAVYVPRPGSAQPIVITVCP